MKKNTLLLTIILLSFFNHSNAQKAPIKFGKVDLELVKMTEHPSYSSVEAIVICDYGRFDAERFKFTRTLRLKILKKSGYSRADFTFSRISASNDVRGKTYNWENGEVVETKLSKESIFIERITEDLSRVKVAMPNVREGSVIDLEISFSGLPSEWYFQNTIPVLWSELRIEESRLFEFNKISLGYEPLTEVHPSRWVAKDMPPAKGENFMDNINNYITKFQIELSAVHVPGIYYRNFSTSWGDIARTYYGSDYFGQMIQKKSGNVKKIKEEILAMNLETKDKIERAVSIVRSRMKWNGSHSDLSSSMEAGHAMRDGKGNSADLNLYLLMLLRELGITANPVILSTRNHGIVSPFLPSISRFNHVIIQYELDGETGYIDATDYKSPVGMLPPKCVNFQGRLLDGQVIKKVDLNPNRFYEKKEMIKVKLDNEGTVKGTLEVMYKGYAAREFRKKFNGETKYITSLNAEFNGIQVDSIDIQGLKSSEQPVKESRCFRFENRLVDLDDSYYFDPLIFNKLVENPFKSTERTYPINFNYPQKISNVVQIELPDNLKIEALPSPVRIQSPDKTMVLMFSCSGAENRIMISYKFTVKKHVYNPEEYLVVKSMYDTVIEKLKEGILLAKN